jgi:acetate CoA/acetoacetate CoA-transferase beta subunit
MPLRGLKVVRLIVTDLAVLEVTAEGVPLTEVPCDTTPEHVRRVTEASLVPAPGSRRF